jgi:hypothetical protein
LKKKKKKGNTRSTCHDHYALKKEGKQGRTKEGRGSGGQLNDVLPIKA